MIAAKTHMHMFVIMSEYRLHECCTIASISLACTSNGHIYIYLYILREYIYIMHIHIYVYIYLYQLMKMHIGCVFHVTSKFMGLEAARSTASQ